MTFPRSISQIICPTSILQFLNIKMFYGVRLLASRPIPASLEDLEFSVGIYSLSYEASIFRRWNFVFTLPRLLHPRMHCPGSMIGITPPVDVGVGFAGSAD
jgi:hypothetical protein